jgi:single-stranded DNA-binding protein
MRGTNAWHGSGNVGQPIKFATTKNDTDCCSFMVAIDGKNNTTTWVRINVYGGLVSICRQKLEVGGYIVINGELMNRGVSSFSDKVTEVRAVDLVFVNQSKRNDYENPNREIEDDRSSKEEDSK